MTQHKNNPFLEMFEDPEQVARYAEGPPRFMPGFWDLHKMASVLVSETAPDNANVLVLGAGGGLELEALAMSHASWSFAGVDPAKEMLDEAERRLGPLAKRVEFHHGFIDTAPEGPFDAATCLLTLHFLDKDERKKTLTEICRRLNPGAPFISAHCSFPQDKKTRPLWLSRYAAFARAAGAEPQQAEQARAAVDQVSTMYDPEADVKLLRASGFRNVTQFYHAFTWRGWVGYAPD